MLPACVHAQSPHSVTSDSLQPYGLEPARLLCARDAPGKNTGVGCHALLQRIVLINPGIESTSPVVPALQADSLPPSLLGSQDAACCHCY